VEQLARRGNRLSRLTLVTGLGILSLVTAVSSAVPASAQSGIQVFVGYADDFRADVKSFPTPWYGSPQTTFEGCAPSACNYDAGAVRVVNNTGSTVSVDSIKVHIDTCTYGGWPSATLAPGADLIVTELPSGTKVGCPGPVHMDTSDVGPQGKDWSLVCTPDSVVPSVEVTISGTTTTYADSGQVLNTGGMDGACGGKNESTQWTVIGYTPAAPCNGTLFSLAPATQTHGLGTTATISATFSNSCGQALSNVAVHFAAAPGPNAGRTGTGTTDANGVATFSYTSQLVGTDTFHASITNLVGTIISNPVTVTWVAFAPGGGAFVIGDLENHGSAQAYWWGAQWWKKDLLSSGLAPAAFKGFELSNASPWCGQTWTTRPGNSPHPPKAVPAGTVMAVIVASHITKKGPVISGDIVHIVLVRTNPGYGPNPGHPGTGTIVGQLC
jgi:Bacterial Ig-like domain (group 1)